MDIKETGLCQEQYELLQVELEKALDTGYLMHTVPHRLEYFSLRRERQKSCRHYDYAAYYGAEWKPPPELRGDDFVVLERLQVDFFSGIPPPPETPERVEPVRPRPLKEYPTFNPGTLDECRFCCENACHLQKIVTSSICGGSAGTKSRRSSSKRIRLFVHANENNPVSNVHSVTEIISGNI